MQNKKNLGNLKPPKLTMPRNEAIKRINLQIIKGKKLKNIIIDNMEDFKKLENEVSKWHLFNKELLTRCFDSYKLTEEYEQHIQFMGQLTREWIYKHSDDKLGDERLKEYINSIIIALESFRERLLIIPEINNIINRKQVEQTINNKKKVLINLELGNSNIFIVHGHDMELKESIARFLQNMNLNPIILHEQPDKGRTIIEKFEDYSNVFYAIVLLTPDDLGRSRHSKREERLRARQNVIFELGYFIGKLGRKRVCAIYKEGVELPSDFLGILYIPVDKEGGWRLKLAKEIKHSGIKIDLNKAI